MLFNFYILKNFIFLETAFEIIASQNIFYKAMINFDNNIGEENEILGGRLNSKSRC